jgi:hypothetical protein
MERRTMPASGTGIGTFAGYYAVWFLSNMTMLTIKQQENQRDAMPTENYLSGVSPSMEYARSEMVPVSFDAEEPVACLKMNAQDIGVWLGIHRNAAAANKLALQQAWARLRTYKIAAFFPGHAGPADKYRPTTFHTWGFVGPRYNDVERMIPFIVWGLMNGACTPQQRMKFEQFAPLPESLPSLEKTGRDEVD